jgi:hypothetical protein|tara:strand:+ start:1536 stop:2483 length:948 start_codon:yes stop_codon:yes gene_type:complete
MIVKANPEFGIELALVVPYAYHLHTQGKLDTVITSKGMKPFYYFCDDVREEFNQRTIDNSLAGLDELPNNWIHGVNPLEEPAVLNYDEWTPPPYKEHYGLDADIINYDTGWEKSVFISNKYNLEHGQQPFGFFDIQCLYDMFTYITSCGYEVIYKRATNKESEFAIDENEINSIHKGYTDIVADVEGVGVISDRDLPKYMEGVTLFDDLIQDEDYNTTQMKVMANCDYFISVCGGNSILSSYFGGTMMSYIHKGKELRPNYFGENSYFRKLSNAKIIPVYDVIGKVNTETYDHKVNTTEKQDYTELLEVIKNEIK